MELTVLRETCTDKSTPGTMLVDGSLFCYTIEDVERAVKIKHETAIPAGRYKLSVSMSSRFKREMILLHDVPNFEGVRIHSGNDNTSTSGCIIVAKNRVNADYIQGDSRKLENLLTSKVKAALANGEECFINITYAKGVKGLGSQDTEIVLPEVNIFAGDD